MLFFKKNLLGGKGGYHIIKIRVGGLSYYKNKGGGSHIIKIRGVAIIL